MSITNLTVGTVFLGEESPIWKDRMGFAVLDSTGVVQTFWHIDDDIEDQELVGNDPEASEVIALVIDGNVVVSIAWDLLLYYEVRRDQLTWRSDEANDPMDLIDSELFA